MKPSRSLVRQYVAFVAAFVAVLSAGAFRITSDVTRDGLEDLFRQRFDQAARVLEEYAKGRDLARITELQSVLGSPRFLAAVETRDPATIADAVPTHGILRDADFVRFVEAEDGRELYASPRDELRYFLPLTSRPVDGVERIHVVGGDSVYEIVVADVWANNGTLLGRLEIMKDAGTEFARDLRRLTGLDVVLLLDGRVVDRSHPGVARTGTLDSDPATLGSMPVGAITRRTIAGIEAIAIRLEDPTTGFTVVFFGSVDEAIAPIMERVRRRLLVLAIAGGLVATVLVGVFTKRRVGRQVERLVRHTERIASGDLEFEITRESSDELGYLAGELEKMRAELQRSRIEVESLHRARMDSERLAAVGQMATGIIHDLKSPMAVVQGTADLIRSRDPGNESLAKQCGVIRRQVERMVGLARDVIEFSRGDTVLEPEPVDLAEFLVAIREFHEGAFRQAGVQLVSVSTPGIRVLVDPDRMQRVLDNLLTNAREASGVGDTVVLEGRHDDTGVRIEVRDEGSGIAAGIVDTLFDPFVTHGKRDGSGLGLAITRKIVEDHGATISVTSEPGRGTSFVVSLPAKLRLRTPDPTAKEEEGVVR